MKKNMYFYKLNEPDVLVYGFKSDTDIEGKV